MNFIYINFICVYDMENLSLPHKLIRAPIPAHFAGMCDEPVVKVVAAHRGAVADDDQLLLGTGNGDIKRALANTMVADGVDMVDGLFGSLPLGAIAGCGICMSQVMHQGFGLDNTLAPGCIDSDFATLNAEHRPS